MEKSCKNCLLYSKNKQKNSIKIKGKGNYCNYLNLNKSDIKILPCENYIPNLEQY